MQPICKPLNKEIQVILNECLIVSVIILNTSVNGNKPFF